MLSKLKDEGVRIEGVEIGRFKGLGEMTAQQLWETTMNPDTRRLLPVALGTLDQRATVDTMTMLMGRGEAAARRNWLEAHGNEVEVDV
jgi:topoisomerase-4 subunit B